MIPTERKRTPRDGQDRSTRTYERLRDLIVHGLLAPGTRLIESDLAARLEVSRTPVRAAVQRLQQEGYVNMSVGSRNSRASVAPLTRDDARGLFGIVGALEAHGAGLSAGIEAVERAQVARDLTKLNRELLEVSSSKTPDSGRIFDLDMAFHRRYVEAAGSPRLRALHEAIKPQAERYIRLYTSALVGEISLSVREHDAIVEPIRRGEAAAAREATQQNWANASDRLCRVIDTVGERGSW